MGNCSCITGEGDHVKNVDTQLNNPNQDKHANDIRSNLAKESSEEQNKAERCVSAHSSHKSTTKTKNRKSRKDGITNKSERDVSAHSSHKSTSQTKSKKSRINATKSKAERYISEHTSHKSSRQKKSKKSSKAGAETETGDMLPNLKKDTNTSKELIDSIKDLEKYICMAQNRTALLEESDRNRTKKHRNMQNRLEPSNLGQRNLQISPKGIPSTSEVDLSTEERETSTIRDLSECLSAAQTCIRDIKDRLEIVTDTLDCKNSKGNEKTRQGKTSLGDQSSKNKKVVIQLYCAQKADLTNFALQELKTKLSSELVQDGVELNFRILTTQMDIKSNTPLIVICLHSSRLDVDFNNAVSGIPVGFNAAVLIFHHVKKHALPSVPSIMQLTEDAVQNVGIIIDIAFFDGKGLYDCDMNTKAYKTLRTFIKGH